MRKENIVDEIRFLAHQLTEHSFEKHIGEFTQHEQTHCDSNGRPIILADGTLSKTKDRNLGVTTKEGMRSYIESFLKDPNTKSLAIKADFSRLAFYNKTDNVLAIIDKNGENFGTVYRPEMGVNGKVKNLVLEAKTYRKEAPVIEGGYPGMRQAHSRKHLFKDKPTYDALQAFLNQNGRTPMPKPQQREEKHVYANLLNDEQSLAFITEGKSPITIFFNSTHKTLIIASSSMQKIESFKTEEEGFSKFGKLYHAEQLKNEEEIKMLSGSFSNIAEQFKQKTGIPLGLGATNIPSDFAANDSPDDEQFYDLTS